MPWGLHNCYGVLTGLNKKALNMLQLVENAAARLLTKAREGEHITFSITTLVSHLFPDWNFKITFTAPHDQASDYHQSCSRLNNLCAAWGTQTRTRWLFPWLDSRLKDNRRAVPLQSEELRPSKSQSSFKSLLKSFLLTGLPIFLCFSKLEHDVLLYTKCLISSINFRVYCNCLPSLQSSVSMGKR